MTFDLRKYFGKFIWFYSEKQNIASFCNDLV